MPKHSIKETALNDLDYIKTLAEDGANTPLLGGRIGLMWSCLLIPTLLVQGLILMQIINIPLNYIGFAWMVFGILGGVLTFILGKSLDKKPGAFSSINRTEQATWTATTIVMFGFAVSVAIGVLIMGKPYWLYDIILAFAFGTYVINYYVLANLSGQKQLYIPAIIAFVLMVIMMINIGNPIIYLIAAVGVIFTAVIPSLMSLKNEPKDVV